MGWDERAVRPGFLRGYKREGSSHSLWINPKSGVVEAIPRHKEIKEPLARRILKNLNGEYILIDQSGERLTAVDVGDGYFFRFLCGLTGFAGTPAA